MVDPFPYRIDTPSSPELASRVQARLDQLDPGPVAEEPEAPVIPPRDADAPESWVIRSHEQTRGGNSLEARIDRQLQILRDQLDQAFDDLEDRLAETDARASLAEARVSVAETRASVAEARAADAETRANAALHRVDELLGEIARLLGPGGSGGDAQDLRRALERLGGPLDQD